MRTVKYVPEACKGEEKVFEGNLEIRLPTFDEKFEYLESLGMNLDDAEDLTKVSKLALLKSIRAMVRLSKPHYVAVNLKKIQSGEVYKTYDDLSTDPDAHGILTEVASKMLEGFSLGKR